METINSSSSAKSCTLVTEQFATLNGVKSQTVRKRYCETGSYFGIIPEKLLNSRLLWPNVQVKA